MYIMRRAKVKGWFQKAGLVQRFTNNDGSIVSVAASPFTYNPAVFHPYGKTTIRLRL